MQNHEAAAAAGPVLLLECLAEQHQENGWKKKKKKKRKFERDLLFHIGVVVCVCGRSGSVANGWMLLLPLRGGQNSPPNFFHLFVVLSVGPSPRLALSICLCYMMWLSMLNIYLRASVRSYVWRVFIYLSFERNGTYK